MAETRANPEPGETGTCCCAASRAAKPKEQPRKEPMPEPVQRARRPGRCCG